MTSASLAPSLPPGLEHHKTTPEFTATTVPQSLLTAGPARRKKSGTCLKKPHPIRRSLNKVELVMVRPQAKTEEPGTEAELIRRAVRKDEAAIRAIIQKHNQRLYRVARSILGEDSEADDVLQDAYLLAFSKLSEFRGHSRLSTWLTRIVVNEALQRLRRRKPFSSSPFDEARSHGAQVIPFPGAQQSDNPERTVAQQEICQLVERAIDALKQEFRTVLVARVLEGMSIEETAESLGIKPETVKTRLHRARGLLKGALADHMSGLFSDVFPFDGQRCERVTNAIVARLSSE